MKLAQIDTSVYYQTVMPSTKKKTKFRPFSVREEKALLTAQESDSVDTMLVTLEEVIRNCVKDCPAAMTTFDVEYLFLQIRAKSVGEESRISINCKHCDSPNIITIDLTKAELTNSNTNLKIKLNDKLYVKMRYPSILSVAEMSKDNIENQTQLAISHSIECVYFGEEVLRTEDTDFKDLEDFVLNRTDEELRKLIEFVENIPTVKLQHDYECRECEKPNTVVLTSLADFF